MAYSGMGWVEGGRTQIHEGAEPEDRLLGSAETEYSFLF